MSEVHNMDCLVFAVAHDCFKKLPLQKILACFGDLPNEDMVVIDIKSILNKQEFLEKNICYWRL